MWFNFIDETVFACIFMDEMGLEIEMSKVYQWMVSK